CIVPSTGTVVISRQQSNGQGRGSNTWTSPDGCAMFTIHCNISLQSLLGQRLSLLQLIAAVAIVQAIEKSPEYKSMNLKIKWPNDIFIGEESKLGGILATSSISGDDSSITIGCGVNIHNSSPSICVNDVINNINKTKNMTLDEFTTEEFIVRTLNFVNTWISDLTTNNQSNANKSINHFYRIYESLWMHQYVLIFLIYA
ncbi:unnamed protein product, partial [Didymodactylos carnosus]